MKKEILDTILLLLRKYDKDVYKEAVFKDIMPTNRRFRADYYLPNLKTIIEVNGGQYINGRHNRGGVGYENDLTKLNLAQRHGFKIYQFTYEMIKRGELTKTLDDGME